ncbi:Uncharacterised protein [Enterobacter cloacae]|nr:Uncharacterised protein [Enterobacter cloacae]
MNTADRFIVVIREGQYNRTAFFEELTINTVQISFELNALTMAQARPPGSMAVTTVNNGKIMFAIFHRDIISKNKLRCF